MFKNIQEYLYNENILYNLFTKRRAYRYRFLSKIKYYLLLETSCLLNTYVRQLRTIFFIQKFSKRIFTWTVLSTLDSRAANNFSLISFSLSFFLFFISIFIAKHATRNLFRRGKICFYFDLLSTKGKLLFGQPALEFFNFIGEKKKSLRQKPERLLLLLI